MTPKIYATNTNIFTHTYAIKNLPGFSVVYVFKISKFCAYLKKLCGYI